MFVRFRETPYGLQVSLIRTRREGGKVRHEHIAGLGAITIPASAADRIDFWRRLHARLSALANWIGDEQGKILGAVHERIPMPTPDELRATQLDNSKADARYWEGLRAMHARVAEDHKALMATTEKAIAAGEAAARAGAEATAAQSRVERIERGESVAGGLGKPMSCEDMVAALKAEGWTWRDIQRMERLGDLPRVYLEDVILPEMMKRKRRVENAVVDAAWRKFRRK
jgi:hypothetical protein